MGAVFNDMALDGKLTKEQVKAKFIDRCEQDGYEDGHSYSGSFSEFRGLEFHDKTFDGLDDAFEYVDEHGEKWGAAVCVRYKHYKTPKSAKNHQKAISKLMGGINFAENKLRAARGKARINNRSTTPSYVTNAEKTLATVTAKIQPKIDERRAKIKELNTKAAAKSTKWGWYLGGNCSS